MRKIIYLLVILAIVFCFSKISIAQEHPGKPAKSEHPGMTTAQPGKEKSGAEHPGSKAMLSAAQIIKGIKEHIASVTKAGGGYYSLYDDKEGKDLRLKLIRVHDDKVSYIKNDDAYFACTDFVTEDGKTKYDVDFWMKESKGKKLEVYQTKIHKKDGGPRFTYKDDEIVPVESSQMAPEEPTGMMAPEART